MGSLFKSKSSSSSSKSQSEPWKPAQDSLKKSLSEINSWYNSAKNEGYISPTGDLGSIYSDYLSGLGGITGQAQSGVQDLLSQAGQAGNSAISGYTNAAQGGLNYSTDDIARGAGSLIDNDLLQGQIDAVNRGIEQNLTERTFTGIDRNAAGSGNMGSSRAGVAQAIAARDASQQMADNAASIRGNAYQNALNTSANTLGNNVQTQLAGIGGNANLSNALAGQASNYSGTVMSGLAPLLESAQLNQTITAANQADQIGQRDYLADLIQQYYLPTAATVGGMGGTSNSTQTQPGSSMFNSLLSGGAAAGSIFKSFSDVRLKENVRKVGTENGHNIYEWDWTDEGKKLAGNQKTRGVLAQEVLSYSPEAISEDKDSGYLMVDYSKLM